PICDQGGECDLQDQAMGYGSDKSRFSENKRAVKVKYMGPLISTTMTRCIHCTRCIRFASEVAGVPELGATGRGENMEVGTYVAKALTSELSGNMIDLCPVGALTSGPYAFNARPWELTKTESIDVTDAVGSNIRVDSRGPEVKRILPRLNEDVNEEWISDKARFSCDGLKAQRLDKPYVRRDGKLVAATWPEAFAAVAAAFAPLQGEQIAAIAGDLADCESMTALKDLMTSLGSQNIDCRQDGAQLDPAARAGYLFNTTISGIDRADAILLIGTNPRREAPVLNARIRKRYVAGGVSIASIGEPADMTYPVLDLGNSASVLKDLASGKGEFAQILKDAKRPMLIVGQGALTRPDGLAVLDLARTVADKLGFINKADNWNGFNVLHTAAARVGGLDLGFVPGAGGRDVSGILEAAQSGDIKAVYLLDADEIDTAKLQNAFVIYQGHHGDAGAHCADVILPGAAYTEKPGTYVNTEGRVQLARLSVFPPGDAREDWTIIRALSEVLGKTLPFNDLQQVRGRMVDINGNFLNVDEVRAAKWEKFGAKGKLDNAPFVSPVSNFYMTNSISRASVTMAKCADEFLGATDQKTGTDG
ncbi:MAG: NADH-quinone oxidoreductase subunit G, partial [Rhodospirillales bacterium]|nr:NADH-quinone oxidoreductase subunit G [Rhodospirillales bacterium]